MGRADLLCAVEARLDAGAGVVLTGPSGIGKTAILDALADSATRRGARVLRASAAESERWLPYAGLADLLGQVPTEAFAALPPPQRAAIDEALQRGADPGGDAGDGDPDEPDLARCLAWQALLEWSAATRPVLLVLDDTQWLDASSAAVIAYAARRMAGRPVRAVVAQRWPERPPARPLRAGRLCPPPVDELTVPPLAADDLAELLDAYGLPCRAANKLHAESGGNPYLALALGGAFADRQTGSGLAAPLPERVRAMLHDRVVTLPASVRETLLVAAIATRPTVEQLRLAGRRDAERDIRLAAQAGLVVLDGGVVRFTPPAAATVLQDSASAQRHSAVHMRLSIVAIDSLERTRHRALASSDPDEEVARSLVAAAQVAQARGARGLVADLYLLAADRTPPDLHAERLDWLVAAAEAAAAVSRPELARRAVDAILAGDSPPRTGSAAGWP